MKKMMTAMDAESTGDVDVTVGGLNEVQVFRTDDFSRVATIPAGTLSHGLWPSSDGSREYVGSRTRTSSW